MQPDTQSSDPLDYYEVLGCHPRSDNAQIQTEFRARARKIHPDKRPDNNHSQWTQVNEAYGVLGDPVRRAQYDRWRAARLPVPFGQWLQYPHSHTMHWSFDYQKAIDVQKPEPQGRPDDRDLYAMFRNYQI
ncbi:DnaJ sub C member 12 [Coemansia sp. Cherry 401B]|nr:DnaJ sub C member 12 [Coemansia sp. Cherry 401B]